MNSSRFLSLSFSPFFVHAVHISHLLGFGCFYKRNTHVGQRSASVRSEFRDPAELLCIGSARVGAFGHTERITSMDIMGDTMRLGSNRAKLDREVSTNYGVVFPSSSGV